MNEAHTRVKQSSDFLRKWDQGNPLPDICVVLGSGLADALPQLETMPGLQFGQIPGFAEVSVLGHKGELRVGTISGTAPDGSPASRRVAFLRGRNHAYEGHDASAVVHNVRTMCDWGVKGLLLTNAAGCLEEDWVLGRMMLISDHINFTGINPLVKPHGAGFGPHFQDLTACYCPIWRKAFKETAARLGENLYEGVYFGVLGPSYETPAEIRMMKALGAHAVGMSTVLEAIAARQMGTRVAALSCLTNHGAGLKADVNLEHDHVVQMGKVFAKSMATLVVNTLLAVDI